MNNSKRCTFLNLYFSYRKHNKPRKNDRSLAGKSQANQGFIQN